MEKNRWQLQEAKSKFSKLVEQVREKGPQIVTKHGEDSVVVISCEEFRKLVRKRTDFLTFLRSSPLADVDLDIERDKNPPRRVAL